MISLRKSALVLSFLLPLPAQAAEVPVGAVLGLSGPTAGYGAACRNAITMALEDFSTKVKGKFKLSFEDDANNPTRTVSAVRSLKQREGTKIFLTWASNTSNAVNRLADREDFIVFAIASDPEVPKGKKNVFSYWVTPDAELQQLVAAMKRRNLLRIAIITGQQEALLAFRAELNRRAPAAGITVLSSDEVTTDQTDFKPILNRIGKLERLDGIFNNLYGNHTGLFARQAQELGIKVPLFAIEMYEDPAVIDLAEGALEGQFFVSAPDGSGDFIKRYRARFPKDSIMAAANCYDYVGLLANAPDLSVEGFRTYLETLKDYNGAVGTVSTSGDHRFTLPAAVKVIKGKEYVVEMP